MSTDIKVLRTDSDEFFINLRGKPLLMVFLADSLRARFPGMRAHMKEVSRILDTEESTGESRYALDDEGALFPRIPLHDLDSMGTKSGFGIQPNWASHGFDNAVIQVVDLLSQMVEEETKCEFCLFDDGIWEVEKVLREFADLAMLNRLLIRRGKKLEALREGLSGEEAEKRALCWGSATSFFNHDWYRVPNLLRDFLKKPSK